MTAPPLVWSMAKSSDGTKLVVDFTFHNIKKHKVYLTRKLVVSAAGDKYARSDRLTVMTTDDPTVCRIVLGAVSSDRPAYRLYTPEVEPVDPGQSITRRFELPLPLTSWNPVGGTNPLSPTTRRAVLIVYGIAGEIERWLPLPSDDPEPLEVPDADRGPLLFEGATLPLPA
jgi:hypothetical protein